MLDELWDAYPRLTETEIRNALGQFRFVGEDVYKTVSVLSGGERARLTLCKLILSRMNLLILDEPTNHLDIDSREALEGALSAFDGTVIAVSHDRYFIEKLATRILEIAPGHGISGTVSGSGSDFTDYRVTHPGTAYTEYRQFMEARQSGSVAPSRMGVPSAGVPDVAPDEPSSSREAYLQARQSAAEQRKRRHRLERLRAESATLEADIDRLTAEINGDAATDDALDALEAAQAKHPRKDCRHILIHAQTIREEQLDRLEAAGYTPSFFTAHVYYWGDRHRDLFLGPERAARMDPMRSALDRGLVITAHCDSPIVPADPLLSIWVSVNRLTSSGQVLGPDQRISVLEALRAHTFNPAWQNFQENAKGSIEPGKLADLVVLDANPLEVDPAGLRNIGILETIVGGKTVYSARA